ncbi:hypothetical protein SKAU_G00076820 [Synaphobranchus kaupii]|uniref:Uncharacterized protein n=1 Tax=Synaphobranchus kaupii TaxID=118154 RepID=A0A9Q1JCA8_SYNKA|nr:hypothetical protein SKAU_G00076820 [Synaphobranchus kaupii]
MARGSITFQFRQPLEPGPPVLRFARLLLSPRSPASSVTPPATPPLRTRRSALSRRAAGRGQGHLRQAEPQELAHAARPESSPPPRPHPPAVPPTAPSTPLFCPGKGRRWGNISLRPKLYPATRTLSPPSLE